MVSSGPLRPTYVGYINHTQDALILLEACLVGQLSHVARRPHDRERADLIQSGNIFIYEEHSSGIKRWTDGVPWSPSRILGNCLVYRQLVQPFPPGEKKRANKRSNKPSGINKRSELHNGGGDGYNSASNRALERKKSGTLAITKDKERSLYGSLVDSYGFKEDGLVKKTISVTVGGVLHHLVSYYAVDDVIDGKLRSPSLDPRFDQIQPRAELVHNQNFRTAINEVETLTDRPALRGGYLSRSGFDIPSNNSASRSISRPTPLTGYASTGIYSPQYQMSMPPAQFTDGLSPATTNGAYVGGQFAQSPSHNTSSNSTYGSSQFSHHPGIFTGPKSEPFEFYGQPRQRFNSISTTNAVRPQMSSNSFNMDRRHSTFEGEPGLGMSGITGTVRTSSGPSMSGLPLNSMESNNTLYTGPRASQAVPQGYPLRRPAMRNLHTDYERSSINNLMSDPEVVSSRTSWQSQVQMGNVSTDHGHYLPSWNGP